MDEVGFCDPTAPNVECCWCDSPDPLIDPELEDFDEDYPNKVETLRNMFPID